MTLLAVRSGSDYTAYVINFKPSPVAIKPLKDGPGFTVENKSGKTISKFRFGCVKETKHESEVTFAFTPENVSLDSTGPESKITFKNWTPAQLACSRRSSKIGVVEVLFSDNSAWSAPLNFERVFGKDGPFIIR